MQPVRWNHKNRKSAQMQNRESQSATFEMSSTLKVGELLAREKKSPTQSLLEKLKNVECEAISPNINLAFTFCLFFFDSRF